MKFQFLAAAAAALVLPAIASAATLTGYTFENLTLPSSAPGNTSATPPTPTAGSYAADTGTGTFTGLHASSATIWSTPGGNGSSKAISSDHWAVGDYYQFSADTTGVTGVKVRFDATGSNTGPRDFKLQYSTNGTTFTDFAGGTYSLGTGFNTTTAVTTTPPRFTFDLSSITGLDNNPSAAFRLVDTSTNSINNGTVGTGGTSRVDNILVGAIAVPEPTTLGLLAGGLTILARRRKA